MPRLPLIQNESASEIAKKLLAKTDAQLGKTPNLYRAMANSPAALEGYLNFREALTSGKLTVQMREQIALLVAHENHCRYCVAAHTFRSKKIGISRDELLKNVNAESSEVKTQVALQFAREIIEKKGKLSDSQFQDFLSAGWTHEEMTEIVAHIALNIFSNFFNHIAEPELDFPVPELKNE